MKMRIYNHLKKVLLISFSFLLIGSCQLNKTSKNFEIFSGNEWYLGEKLIFRNDSSICFTQYDTVKNTATHIQSFPMNLTDTSLIYTRFQPRGYFDTNREFSTTHFEKLVDTIRYDLMYVNKNAKLILYTDPFPTILSTQSALTIPETHHFEQIKFRISEFTIGDQIDRSMLKTKGIYNYPNYTIEDCEYIDNKDITFKIIGYNTIFSIERRRIENYRIKEIVEVVTAKLGLQPEYRPMRQWIDGSDYEYEFYRWSGYGVQINLSRSKYVGNAVYKTLVGNDSWTLSYDDSFIQAILVETYKNGKPHSSIIN